MLTAKPWFTFSLINKQTGALLATPGGSVTLAMDGNLNSCSWSLSPLLLAYTQHFGGHDGDNVTTFSHFEKRFCLITDNGINTLNIKDGKLLLGQPASEIFWADRVSIEFKESAKEDGIRYFRILFRDTGEFIGANSDGTIRIVREPGPTEDWLVAAPSTIAAKLLDATSGTPVLFTTEFKSTVASNVLNIPQIGAAISLGQIMKALEVASLAIDVVNKGSDLINKTIEWWNERKKNKPADDGGHGGDVGPFKGDKKGIENWDDMGWLEEKLKHSA